MNFSHPLGRRAVLLGLLSTSTWTLAAGNNTIRISNGDWAPFMGATLAHQGFVSRIVTEAFRLEGIDVKYEFFPWERALRIARTGEFDASIGWYYTEERAKDFLFSDPVFVESQVVFFLKSKPVTWKTLSDLKGKSIGATIGYTYGDEFKQLEESKVLDVQRTTSDEQNLKKLLAGRIDAAVISRAVGTRLVKALGAAEADQITHDPRAVNSGPLHVIFPKSMAKSKDWLNQFNRGLKKLKASGAAERFSQEN